MTDEYSEYINDLYEDMHRINALYEELMWGHDDVLEFTAELDYVVDYIKINENQ